MPFKDVLHETLEETRKDISNAILKQSSIPPTYPSLGPVMFFLADSTTGCIHNWSGTTWEELKLGWVLRAVIAPILDVISEARNAIVGVLSNSFDEKKIKELFNIENNEDEISVSKFKEYFYDSELMTIDIFKQKIVTNSSSQFNIEELVETLSLIFSILPKLKKIKSEYSYKLDEFWKEEQIDRIYLEIDNSKEILKSKLFPKLKHVAKTYLINSGIQFSLTRINENRTYTLIEKLLAITKGRLQALSGFQNLITNTNRDDFKTCLNNGCSYCSSKPNICRYIFEHPRFKKDNKIKENVQNDWKKYLTSILHHDDKNDTPAEYEKRTELLVRLFDFFPQEIESSRIFNQLQRRLTKELTLRKDYEIISLTDLSLLKNLKYPATTTQGYKLYNYTHTLERIYYGGIASKNILMDAAKNNVKNEVVKIDNAFIVPIRIFDSQIKGQLVVLSPDKISKTDCLNAINMHYRAIGEAAKLDFYASILQDISTSSPEGNVFATFLSTNLPKILMLEGLLTWEGSKFINLANMEKDSTITSEEYTHYRLTFTKGDEISDYRRNKIKELEKELEFIQWYYDSKEVKYLLKSTSSEDESVFNIFHENENIKSYLLIRFAFTTFEPVVLVLYFRESYDQIKISVKEMVDTLFYSFIFENPAKLYKKYQLWEVLNVKNHIQGDVDSSKHAFEKAIETIKEIYIPQLDREFQKLIEYSIEPSYRTLKSVSYIYQEILKSQIEYFNIFDELNDILGPYEGNKNCVNIKIIRTDDTIMKTNAYKARLKVIFDNLLRNSFKAFHTNSIKEREIIITIDNNELSNQLKIIYEDNAGGIDLSKFYHEGIFSIKTLREDSRIKSYGLYQVFIFTISMGWQIEYLHIEKPKGTKFIFSDIEIK